jgi:hypothetical protein
VRVEPGQLRKWRTHAGGPEGSVFLVIERDPAFTNDPFWRVLRPEGVTKLWSESRIEGWSEVISEAR